MYYCIENLIIARQTEAMGTQYMNTYFVGTID